MIQLNHAVLHILDFHSGVTVFSQEELQIAHPQVHDFLEKHIEKIYKDAGSNTGELLPSSHLRKRIADYMEQPELFLQLSLEICHSLHNHLSHADKMQSIDFVFCDFLLEGERYLGLLEFANQIAYTHQVVHDGEKVKNEIINHYAILPGPSQRIASFALIDPKSYRVRFIDKKVMIDGEAVQVLPELVLQCSANISAKDTVKAVNQIITKVAENHGVNSAVAISKAKNWIRENAESSDHLAPREFAEKIFGESQLLKREFHSYVEEAKLPETVPIEQEYALKTARYHKMKTDTGIEITVPLDFFQDPNYIEFINQPDGTISIAIKNIGKILNRP